MLEFGADLSITYVMGGLAREFEGDITPMIVAWLDASEPLGDAGRPAALVRGADRLDLSGVHGRKGGGRAGPRGGRALPARAARGADVLPPQARRDGGAGGGGARGGARRGALPRSLDSHAIVEAFGADLEETRGVAGLVLPAVRFGADGWWRRRRRTRSGARRRWRRAARRPATRCRIRWPRWRGSGAWRPSRSRLSATCPARAPRPSCGAWRPSWRLKPVRVLTGTLWELPRSARAAGGHGNQRLLHMRPRRWATWSCVKRRGVEAGRGVRLIAHAVAGLLGGSAVVAQAVGLDDQPELGPEEVDAEAVTR